MFRLTQFVILFLFFCLILCAYAAPAAPAEKDAAKAKEISLAPKVDEAGNPKDDLNTDATTYLAYSYGYAPSLGYNLHGLDLDWSIRSINGWPNTLIRTLPPIFYV